MCLSPQVWLLETPSLLLASGACNGIPSGSPQLVQSSPGSCFWWGKSCSTAASSFTGAIMALPREYVLCQPGCSHHGHHLNFLPAAAWQHVGKGVSLQKKDRLGEQTRRGMRIAQFNSRPRHFSAASQKAECSLQSLGRVAGNMPTLGVRTVHNVLLQERAAARMCCRHSRSCARQTPL